MANNTIEGNPTKRFFIDMITRDISVEDAIIDLLDNSIDGANQINHEDLSKFYINIEVSKDLFVIKDNCGGFSLERAMKYAFRFGRPDDVVSLKNSVGRFGIGMKRALFKMGKCFSVETKNNNDHFRVDVNVEDWCKKIKTLSTQENGNIKIDDWSFDCYTIDDLSIENGTIITIYDLKEEVKSLFVDDNFLNSLYNGITKMLCFSLSKGLHITLNKKQIKGFSEELLIPKESRPYFINGNVDGVHYKIVAGLGKIGEPKRSGWYIFCNNRLVVESDQTSLTGWGVNSIPKWHIDYVMFRGFVFLDSEETSKLPLTTTKKGLDASSIVYRKILPYMRNAMIKVTSFLKHVTGLKEEANEYRKMIGETSYKISIEEILNYTPDNNEEGEKSFLSPILDLQKISEKKDTVRVAYDVKKKIAEEAKNNAEVNSYKELGKTTFNYYIKMEGIKDE